MARRKNRQQPQNQGGNPSGPTNQTSSGGSARPDNGPNQTATGASRHQSAPHAPQKDNMKQLSDLKFFSDKVSATVAYSTSLDPRQHIFKTLQSIEIPPEPEGVQEGEHTRLGFLFETSLGSIKIRDEHYRVGGPVPNTTDSRELRITAESMNDFQLREDAETDQCIVTVMLNHDHQLQPQSLVLPKGSRWSSAFPFTLDEEGFDLKKVTAIELGMTTVSQCRFWDIEKIRSCLSGQDLGPTSDPDKYVQRCYAALDKEMKAIQKALWGTREDLRGCVVGCAWQDKTLKFFLSRYVRSDPETIFIKRGSPLELDHKAFSPVKEGTGNGPLSKDNPLLRGTLKVKVAKSRLQQYELCAEPIDRITYTEFEAWRNARCSSEGLESVLVTLSPKLTTREIYDSSLGAIRQVLGVSLREG